MKKKPELLIEYRERAFPETVCEAKVVEYLRACERVECSEVDHATIDVLPMPLDLR